jgi:hypothetical protein
VTQTSSQAAVPYPTQNSNSDSNSNRESGRDGIRRICDEHSRRRGGSDTNNDDNDHERTQPRHGRGESREKDGRTAGLTDVAHEGRTGESETGRAGTNERGRTRAEETSHGQHSRARHTTSQRAAQSLATRRHARVHCVGRTISGSPTDRENAGNSPLANRTATRADARHRQTHLSCALFLICVLLYWDVQRGKHKKPEGNRDTGAKRRKKQKKKTARRCMTDIDRPENWTMRSGDRRGEERRRAE